MKLFPSQFLVFFLLMPAISSAQTENLKINLVSGTNGVSLGKINGMTRDKQGFMWFSDQTNRCIIRFDGSHMTRFQYNPKNLNSLGGYYPECLAVDSSGNMWIGFYGMGLDKYDPVSNQFTHYRNQKNDPGSLSNDFVASVLVDHTGNIWVGNYGGLDLLDKTTGKFKHYRHNSADASSLSHDTVRVLYEDKAGEIWVGTGFPWIGDNRGGLNRLDRNTGTFTRYMNDPANPNSLSDNKVRAILEDSYGNFWIGTRGNGLHILDKKTGLITRLGHHLSNAGLPGAPSPKTFDDHITFIREDADKKIWIGTLVSGIVRYDPISKNLSQFGTREDKTGLLKDSSSWWMYPSPDGIVWLSTQNSNLFKIDIYNVVIPAHIINNITGVTAINEESESVLWYGTINNGLIRKDFKNGTTRQFVNEPGNPNSLSHNRVTKILKDKEGNFWIGTVNALNHYDLKTGKFTRYDHVNNTAISNTDMITCLSEDKNSNIWLGTLGSGLKMFDRKTGQFTKYLNDPKDNGSIGSHFITSLLEDESTGLWIGTGGNAGLSRLNYQTGRFKRYLPGLNVNCIYRDADGVIWVGTPSDLFKYERESDNFIPFAGQTGGTNIVEVASLVADNENNIWASAETGIYMINKNRDQVIRYGKENGLRDANNFFYGGAAFKRQNGELNIGCDGGYYAFYPAKLKVNSIADHLYFTGFWLNNEEVIPGKEEPLHESIDLTKTLRLSYNQNVFSISAAVVDFRSSGGKRIFYKLDNYDNFWRSSNSEERIHYFKVPPGKYTFRIKTANSSNGEWQEKSIDIIVSPPWWSTWWAYTIYALLFIAAVYLVHRSQRKRLIEAEKERSRAKELAHAREIEKAYDELRTTQAQLIQSEKMASLGELTAGIAHEIQNPLNFVNNFSEVNTELIDEMQQELKAGNDDEAITISNNIKENQEKINFHGKRADAIVKGMLQHSRSSSGTKEPTDINALADEYLRLAYHGLRAKDKSFNATVKTDFDTSIGNIKIIPQDIGRVILNLITNAFYAVTEKKKQQPDGYEPTVSVSTKKKGDKVEVKIKDNGNGIPQKVLDKIFQPFFTTKPTGQGTGLGLSLSYDIIKAHGGEIKVETKEGEGTSFIIQISS